MEGPAAVLAADLADFALAIAASLPFAGAGFLDTDKGLNIIGLPTSLTSSAGF